jgi:hypothetical protein
MQAEDIFIVQQRKPVSLNLLILYRILLFIGMITDKRTQEVPLTERKSM